MSKTNFSKVEKSLEEGLIKIQSEQLLKEADALKKNAQNPDKIPSKDFCNVILKGIERDLQRFLKLDEKISQKINSDQIDLKKFISNPSLLTPQDWKAIKEIKERLEQYKKELKAKLPIESDEERVEKARLSQSNERINISKKWLPLDTHK